MFKRTVFVAAAAAVGGYCYFSPSPGGMHKRRMEFASSSAVIEDFANLKAIPTRAQAINDLKEKDVTWDVLVIGGGATGSGVALDAVTRGLKVALVEADDFAASTSSRSTKLIHGGVRYLQKAVEGFDYNQLSVVVEALHERAHLVRIAPHLSNELAIALPVYSYWKLPYYFTGMKVYDLLAGRLGLEPAKILFRDSLMERYPTLKSDGLVGGVVFYDGQHDDARMGVSIALTAASHGATVANHVRAVDFIKDEKTGALIGAVLEDAQTGERWTIAARGIVNAAGPFSDVVRKQVDPNAPEMVVASDGVHVVLPSYYAPKDLGMVDESSDGRVIYVLPWRGHVLAGTTDRACKLEHPPRPRATDVNFVLQELRDMLNVDVQPSDVLSVWSGLRPLIRDPEKKSTQALARTHIVRMDKGGLLTVSGGKWTTYRQMAEDAVDRGVKEWNLKPRRGCRTTDVMLIGGHRWTPTLVADLGRKYNVPVELVTHLANNYGDRAGDVLQIALQEKGKGRPNYLTPLSNRLPYIEAEVLYAVRHEMADSAVDVLARRTRTAFLNVQSARSSIERVVELMGDELHWSADRRRKETNDVIQFLKTMEPVISD